MLNTQPFVYGGVPLSPQLYQHADDKLGRIMASIRNSFWEIPADAPRDVSIGAYNLALADIRRCRQELKYEYLGLKDSWL